MKALLAVLAVCIILAAEAYQPTRVQSASTYADYGSEAITNMINDFYTNGRWKGCMSGCGA